MERVELPGIPEGATGIAPHIANAMLRLRYYQHVM
jgi:hypothetical protein